LEYGLALDTGKLNWWPGGLLTFNAQTGFASGFPLQAGVVSPPNFTEVYPTANKPDTQLMEYYLTQVISKEFTLIAGRLNAVNKLDKNRFANDPREQFMNLSMDNDPLFGSFISFSTYGVLGHWQITDNISISPAVYDASTQPGNYFDNLFNDWGFAAEGELTWKFQENLGGALKIDGIYVTKDATALDNPRLLLEKIEGIPAETHSGNWIIALNVEQYLWKPSSSGKKSEVRTASFDFQEPGVGLFGRFSYTPEDRNPWNMYASGGIGGRGIIPGRPYDRLGLGVYWLSESSDLGQQPLDILEDEIGLEAFYNLALTPWAQLSFDFQWINSGISSVDNAVILGTRLLTRF
jgi:porin